MKKKKRLVFGSLFFLALAVFSIAGVLALLSDKGDSLTNTFYPGCLTTSISEEYTPLTITLDQLKGSQVEKSVQVENDGDVSCYIRASVEFSNSDFGAFIEEIGENWEKGTDGWYYYKEPVEPGEATSLLFNHVSSGTMNEKYIREVSEFTIFVSQESVSTFQNGRTFASYEDAWNFYMDRKGDGSN